MARLMSLGRYDYERRYRRRLWTGAAKIGLLAVIILGIALFSYQMGIEQIKGRDASLREDNATLSRQKIELELLASQMQTAVRTAEARILELEGRLQREVPTGDIARIVQLAQARIKDGLAPNRLAFVIESAQTHRECQASETKRFTLATPLLRTGGRSVSFGAGAIAVSGSGQSARNEKGAPENWFDPALPVTLKFTGIDGRTTETSGTLPFTHSVVVNGFEYRFAFAAGNRGFIDVTGDRCPFP